MTSAGLLTAVLGGLLSLISPCAALLLPSFFAYARRAATGSSWTRTCAPPTR